MSLREHIFNPSPCTGLQNTVWPPSPHQSWFVCVCVSKRVGCFTASFLGCVALETNLRRQGPASPTENSLIRICCTNWRMLTDLGRNKAFSLPGTHGAHCGLTLELWALSNHIWLICLPVRGLCYPPDQPAAPSPSHVCKTELKVLIHSQAC